MIQTLMPFLIAYLATCLATAHFLSIESHDRLTPIPPTRAFWVCLLCTPLIGAILYAGRLR